MILEKPFTVTFKEAKEIAGIAREKKLYLFEAITNQYNPNYDKMKELLPRLGDIKLVALNFPSIPAGMTLLSRALSRRYLIRRRRAGPFWI